MTSVHQPFTTAEARRLGVTPNELRGPRYRALLRGVHLPASVPLTFVMWVLAALKVAPGDAVASHTSALRVLGLDVGAEFPIHVSTNSAARTRHSRVVVHRRRHPIARRDADGIAITSAERTFVDCASMLRFPVLVLVAEWLIHQGHTTSERLHEYVHDRHLFGVRRARMALRWLAAGAESPMESWLRLMLVLARLPRPEANVSILDAAGHFVARVDLLFRDWRVIVEYDGRWHERSAGQRRRDRDRREMLEAMGYRVIVVHDTDLASPAIIVRRVHQALVESGYAGGGPVMSVQWHRWFSRLP